MVKKLLFICVLLNVHVLHAQNSRWKIQSDNSIIWNVGQRLPHADHIEMSGEKVSLWMQYGVDKNASSQFTRTIVLPTYRLLPASTIAHLMYSVTDTELPRIIIENKLFKAGVYDAAVMQDYPEKVISIQHTNGIMEMLSALGDKGLMLKRQFFPSVNSPLAIEKLIFINKGKENNTVEIENFYKETAPATHKQKRAPYTFIIRSINPGVKSITPNDSAVFAIVYQAKYQHETLAAIDVLQEEHLRRQRVEDITSLLQLQTPDTVLNTMFNFAKIRAAESIYLTKNGYVHSPGGLRYYAAIWANDQAEYVNPFFAFLGDELGNISAMNSFRWFSKYMNAAFTPIPSSIIDEGDGYWNGAGDRGDMAMIAYGAGRFALAYGNRDSAKVVWPLIEWSLEYLRRKLNPEGVVLSDSDELEGRLPAGKANLNTSALYYDALLSAVYLGTELNKPAVLINAYKKQAKELKANIDRYFKANIDGFKTYRYYKENTVLRAWIATPLTVDIFDRKEGTVNALFSPKLWTEDGLASVAGEKTFWDRSTLYGLRGAFAAGETEKALRFLKYYSQRRLLGDHVPYAVEAYPEGNQRHLSAESGLYGRVFTEGIFGIRPTGFNSFTCTPRLPGEWNTMSLKNIHAFGKVFDLNIQRKSSEQLEVNVLTSGQKKNYLIKDGASVSIRL